jgi:Protein of unknown function (DUF3108)
LFARPASGDAGQKQIQSVPAANLPFQPGEKLTYAISWSNLIQAGTAVMEVSEEKKADGEILYRLISTAHSSRLLSKFYTVSDTIESVFDTKNLRPVSFRLDQSHGKRKKKREMTFNYKEDMVTVFSDGQQSAYPVPADIQDPLSSLYYVRTKQDFIIGKPIIVNVHEDDRNWAVEVYVLGKEKLKTPFGEINTIKVKTYPKYEGVFQNKGEIYIWLTDDARKIPVLMKSTISIGSIVSTLVEARTGENKK